MSAQHDPIAELLPDDERQYPFRYLGDGVYASFDGWQVWLRTFNGLQVTSAVAIEPETLNNLLSYLKEKRLVEFFASLRR